MTNMTGRRIDSDAVRLGQYDLFFEKDEENLEEFFKEKAILELRETPEIKKKALNEFKRLISDDDDLYIPVEDNDNYLLAFLRACKFYPDSAFLKLKNLCLCKVKNPDYFSNLLPDYVQKPFQNNVLSISPNRDQHGRRVLIYQPGRKWNPSEMSLVELTRGLLFTAEASTIEPKTQISGSILILDLEGLSLRKHVLKFTPSYAKMLIDWIQDCMPLRVKGVHIVNQPLIFNVAFNIFKPFINEKLRKRIYLHGGDQVSLLNEVSSKCLPEYYGGSMEFSLDDGLVLWKYLNQYADRYERISQFGYKSKNFAKK